MSSSSADSGSIVALYERRMTDFDRQKKHLDRRADRISHARVATFLAAGGCLLAGWFGESNEPVWLAAGAALFAVFAALVWLYRRTQSEAEKYGQLSRINGEAAARVRRHWAGIPLRATGMSEDEEGLAGDLDLFGHASLFHLLSLANTRMGIRSLRDWLLEPVDPAAVVRRQEAAAELAPLLDLRHELHRRGLNLAGRETDPGPFLRWAEGMPWLARRRWLKWASRVLPVVLLASVVLVAAGVVPPSTWVPAFAVNVVLGFIFSRQIHDIFSSISSRHGEIRDFAGLLELIGATSVASAELVHLRQQVAGGGGVLADRQIGLLGRIMDLANLRFSSMSYFVVQSLLLWDFHVLALLEGWQRRCGRHARRWFDVLGRWEALASSASLVYDNPAWAFPTIDVEPHAKRTLAARSLGHPLIPDDRRVANDVAVGPPGTLLLVTGSNMSGKSTLLRAIGTNVALAGAGAPVCAVEFTMPPVLLATSMRVHDSLAEGVSYYLAELRRLKQIVDASRDQATGSERILLYLLDEILQGTNTAERQIAVRRVLAHLLREGAIGAVSTHDLELAAAPPLDEACRAVHFRETIRTESGRHEMTFDYKLHEGVATTTNALKLLEMVGLCDAGSAPPTR